MQGKRPLIIDAGEDIGMSAVWYTNTYLDAQIFAIEPDRENYELLVKITRSFSDRITPYFGGVWSKDIGLVIENPESGTQHFRTREVEVGTDGAVNAITIARILQLAGVEEVFIAKIDIEGGQAALFKENTEWVKKTNLIVLELDDWQFPWAGTSRPFISCVGELPFDYLLHGENRFCFQEMTFYSQDR